MFRVILKRFPAKLEFLKMKPWFQSYWITWTLFNSFIFFHFRAPIIWGIYKNTLYFEQINDAK